MYTYVYIYRRNGAAERPLAAARHQPPEVAHSLFFSTAVQDLFTERALPTETKVERGMAQSKNGTSAKLSNSDPPPLEDVRFAFAGSQICLC